MTPEIRPATPADIPVLSALLVEDAARRAAVDSALWSVSPGARAAVEAALGGALGAGGPVPEMWLVAEAGARMVGVLHALRLPVPPIYAGRWGAPGLLMPDSTLAPGAPAGTAEALIAAGEAALRATGAELSLAAATEGSPWRAIYEGRGYAPLTLYLSKSALAAAPGAQGVRPATGADLDAVVRLSARHRAILDRLDPFWQPHPEADARFGAWMRKSLTLGDRDMLVAGGPGAVAGYAIAQPVTRLHVPPAHDIAATGVIDDFFHRDLDDPDALPRSGGAGARALLAAAEASFARRGTGTALVVCPAAWRSKAALLKAQGYRSAMVWLIRR